MILNLKDFSQFRGEEQKQAILKHLGPTIENVELAGNRIWVATYIRPEKTMGGVILTTNAVGESQYQSKVGFILKKGPLAFVDETHEGGTKFNGFNPKVGDWVHYRVSDGAEKGFCNVHVREFPDMLISGTITHPELIW